MLKYRLIVLLFLFKTVTINAQNSDCVSAINSVSQDSLVDFVLKLSGRKQVFVDGSLKTIKSRQALHPDNIVAGNYLKKTCLDYGFTAEDIPYSNTGRNIIMYKNGVQNNKEAYILCAHYDCVGGSSTSFQGADDNASGAAALLEAARVLQNTTFPYTLILAFWDEEENGLIGSQAFVPDGPLGFWDVKGAINLDMIGYDGNGDSLGLIHTKPVANSLSLAAKLIDLNKKFNVGLQTRIKNPGETATDHQSFWNVNATAIGFTEDYDFDFSPHWHRFSDSIENMHLPYFTKMSKLAIGAICELSKTGSVVSVEENTIPLLMMHPNPVKDVLYLKLSKPIDNCSISIYTVTGEKVVQENYSGIDIEIDTRNLSSGIYSIKVGNASTFISEKFIKTE